MSSKSERAESNECRKGPEEVRQRRRRRHSIVSVEEVRNPRVPTRQLRHQHQIDPSTIAHWSPERWIQEMALEPNSIASHDRALDKGQRIGQTEVDRLP